jgi:hypothetical protein
MGFTAMSRSSPPLKDLDLKNATRALGGSATDTCFLLETEPGKPGEVFASHIDILNLSTKLSANGTLHWDAPAGRWEILRIGHTATGAHVSTHSEGWGGRVIDLLSPAALDSYWNTNISPMACGAMREQNPAPGPLAKAALRGA